MNKSHSSLFLSLCFALGCSAPCTYGASEQGSFGGGTHQFLTIGMMCYGMMYGAKGQYNTSSQTYGGGG